MQLEVLAVVAVVGQEEGAAQIARRNGITEGSERRVEAGEVRQRRQVFHQRRHLIGEGFLLHRAGVVLLLLEFGREADEHLDQVGNRRASRADVGHEQDGITRRLVHLDAVTVHQHVVLERIAVVAGTADDQRDTRGIEHEFVVAPGLEEIRVAGVRVPVHGHAGLAVAFRHHVLGAQHVEVLLQQRMAADASPHRHRCVDLLLHELEAFEFDLAAADVQRRNELVVRRCRRVRHERLVEGFLDLAAEVLVVHVNHRRLAQCRERLVRRLRRVDAYPRLVRIGQQSRVQQLVVACVRELRGVLGVAGPVGLAAEVVAQLLRTVHGRAHPVGRLEAREAEPGLVPQEDQVRLDGQALFHDPAHVVNAAVEGAVGE